MQRLGGIQYDVGSCHPVLFSMYVTGAVPRELRNLRNTQHLRLGDNPLEGERGVLG